MSEAPERMWIDPDILPSEWDKRYHCDVEYVRADRIEKLQARVAELEKKDCEAATHVESVIAMRTGFTGDPPYVGWKGLGLALNEALDARDAAESKLEKALEALEFYATQDVTYPNVGTVTFHGHDDNGCKARATLAELTGGRNASY